MIVIDASAMVEALVGREVSDELLDALSDDIHVPCLLDVEVLSVLRGLLLGRRIDPTAAEEARHDHFAFSMTRHDIGPLAERIWQLRHQYTSYDASYLALAEALEAPLYTCDAKLDGGGHDAHVVVVHPARRPVEEGVRTTHAATRGPVTGKGTPTLDVAGRH